MKTLRLFLGLLSVAGPFALVAQQVDPLFLSEDNSMQIFVNNRVLAKVNGKPITVLDVMKKMDMLFYRQFPQYASSKAARYQFYSVNWKHVLRELVDKELILADAAENRLVVSNGDVRQELEQLFGPNIISNLDKIDLTFAEAAKMIEGDITIRRMMLYRVNSKALKQITPQEIRSAYRKYVSEHIRPDEWTYRVISVRAPNVEEGKNIAHQIYESLIESHVPFEHLASQIKERYQTDNSLAINISDEFHHLDHEVSPAYKEALRTLSSGTYSHPSEHKSRSNNTSVYRIFYLKEKIPGGVVAFHEVENEIKERLLDEAINKETDLYLKRLRQHFAVNDHHLKEVIPDNFQPFILKSHKS